MGSNSLVSNPCQGCSDPSPILANASLAVAGSGSLAALVFPAPSSGWMGFLVTSLPSLPPSQLVLSGSTFNLKAEGCPFSVQGGFSWHHGHSCHTPPPGGELVQAKRALGGPGSAPHRLHPKASPFTLWGQKALITTPVLLLPLLQLIQTWIVWGNTNMGKKSNHPACCPGTGVRQTMTGQDHLSLAISSGFCMAEQHQTTLSPSSSPPFLFFQSPPLPFPDTS